MSKARFALKSCPTMRAIFLAMKFKKVHQMSVLQKGLSDQTADDGKTINFGEN